MRCGDGDSPYLPKTAIGPMASIRSIDEGRNQMRSVGQERRASPAMRGAIATVADEF